MDIDLNDVNLLNKNGDINLGYLANIFVEYFLNNKFSSIKRLVDNPIDLKLSIKDKKIYLFHSNFFELSETLPKDYYVLKYNNIRVNVIFSKLRNNSFYRKTTFEDVQIPFFFKKKDFSKNILLSRLGFKTLDIINFYNIEVSDADNMFLGKKMFDLSKNNTKININNEENNIFSKNIFNLFENNIEFNNYIKRKAEKDYKKFNPQYGWKSLINKRIFAVQEIMVNNIFNKIFLKKSHKYIAKYFNLLQNKIWENTEYFPIIKKYTFRKNKIMTNRSFEIIKRGDEFKYCYKNYPKLVGFLFGNKTIDYTNKKALNYLNDRSYYFNSVLAERSFKLENNAFQKLMLRYFTLADIKRIDKEFCFEFNYSIYNYNQIETILRNMINKVNIALKDLKNNYKNQETTFNYHRSKTYLLNTCFKKLFIFTGYLHDLILLGSNSNKVNYYINYYIENNCSENFFKIISYIRSIHDNQELLNIEIKNKQIDNEYYDEIEYFADENYSIKLFENLLEEKNTIHNISSKNKGMYKKISSLKEEDNNIVLGAIKYKSKSIGVFKFHINNKKIALNNVLLINKFEYDKEKIHNFVNFFKTSIENNMK